MCDYTTVMTTPLTGYGPSRRQIFDGDERKYELWEIKFIGYLRLKKLHETILTPLADDASEAARTTDATKNADAFAEMIQCLDDRSLSLIIRDAKDDGRKALGILREHYKSKGKPRVITLYTELTTLKMGDDERVTDYMLRAETAATSLKSADENISDSLLIATTEYRPFSTVITQKDKQVTFSEFKVSLRSFEETQKMSNNSEQGDNVMKTADRTRQKKENRSGSMVCYGCGKPGHKIAECQTKRWCETCRSHTHDTKYCRKKKQHSTKTVRETNNSNNVHDEDDKHDFVFKVNVDTSNTVVDGLLVDCGATTHIIHDLDKFTKFHTDFNPEKHYIELADGRRSNNIALRRGDACVTLCDVEGNSHDAILKDALYVPSFKQDIFSVQAATDRGSSVTFSPNDAKLVTPNGTEFHIGKSGNLYYLNSVLSSSMTKQESTSKPLKYWHEILGHCNLNDVISLEKVVNGMRITDKKSFDCEVCVMGKMTQPVSRKPDKRAVKVFDLVHCDLAGPIAPVSKNGFKYALSFIDDYSGIIMIYFIKHKSDAVKGLEKFLADSSPYGKVKRLRSDNGTEFVSDSFEKILIQHSIRHETSAPHSPHQNGTVERSWRSVFEMARCLLIESSLPKQLWPYAVMSSVYIRNRCYNHRFNKTPYEVITGSKPNLANMHIFGTVCYAYVQDKKKLDPRSEKSIFVGYDKGSTSYLVYFPEKHVIRKYRCVKFTDKFEVGKPTDTSSICNDDEMIVTPHQVDENMGNQPEVPNAPENQDKAPSATKYPERKRERPQYYGHSVENNEQINDDDDQINSTLDYAYKIAGVPSSYQEAIMSPDSNKWQKAMEEEMDALTSNNTFELTTTPSDRKVVGGKWVYALKPGPDGQDKYKARFVAKGYSQVPGKDYQETFSPTARMTSIRSLMQLAVQYNLTVHQMDVKTAYLNAPIDCELFVEQPEGFAVSNKDGDELVCKLNKSLYGLKQSGRNWNGVLHSYLISDGFTQSQSDTCVYTKISNDSMTILIIWVDDIIIASNCQENLVNVKANLSKRFKMKDLGKLSYFLGIDFVCKDDSIEMNQTKYIEKMLLKFAMQDAKPRSTPCEVSVKADTESEEPVDNRLYREMVGSLVYVMTATRPDLSFVVTKLSQCLATPTTSNMIMVKHVLRYLKGTIHKGLIFKKSEKPLNLIGFCDADWGGSNDRRSITGYGYMLSEKGPLISWNSRKQPTVALSTCEAEYMSLSSAVQEGKYLSQFLKGLLGSDRFNSVTLNCDNQGAIALSKNPVHHNRSKHIDIRYHFIRFEIQSKFLFLQYISTQDNLADVFTKAVTGPKLKTFVPLLLGI